MAKKKQTRKKKSKKAPPASPVTRPLAVMDIGTSSIRLLIAQPSEDGTMQTLESLRQEATLGEDVFTTGRISTTTTEACVATLKGFANVLREYQIADPGQIRAVATSAVREASNRDAFIDRIYVGTNIDVEIIDQAEETRLTYLSVEPILQRSKLSKNRPVLVVEVGGGSTEVLLIYDKSLEFAHNYRFGSQRLKEMLSRPHISGKQRRKLMETEIKRIVDQINHNVPMEDRPNLILLGGEARFIVTQLGGEPDADTRSTSLKTNEINKLTDTILELSTDDIVKTYNILYPEAETLGATLLTYVMLARRCQTRNVYVASQTLRDGILREFNAPLTWSEDFFTQIQRSVRELGRYYDYDEAHANHVAMLADSLFEQLQPEHQLGTHAGQLLTIAAQLHEIGMYINIAGHHKHTLYLINNSELFGLSKRDQMIIALTARYHRRATPKMRHPDFAALDRTDRITVAKLASILRIADALDRSRNQRIKDVTTFYSDNTLTLSVPRIEDLSLERLALEQKGSLFKDIYGLDIALHSGTGEKA